MTGDSVTEFHIVKILRKEMGLEDNRCWVRNQNRKIPNDTGIYVVAGMVDSRPIGAKTEIINVTITPPGEDAEPYDQPEENISVQVMENIQIDIYSAGNEALLRRWEIVLALNSIYSKQSQDKNFYKIARLPISFVNTAVTEGGRNLNKYSCVISASGVYRAKKVLEPNGNQYYDEFSARVDDAETIETSQGIFEFSIDEDSPETTETGE